MRFCQIRSTTRFQYESVLERKFDSFKTSPDREKHVSPSIQRYGNPVYSVVQVFRLQVAVDLRVL